MGNGTSGVGGPDMKLLSKTNPVILELMKVIQEDVTDVRIVMGCDDARACGCSPNNLVKEAVESVLASRCLRRVRMGTEQPTEE